MSVGKALAAGVAGATALTVLHETARHFISDAPRMDILGMRAIARALRKMGKEVPEDDDLHHTALVGDMINNSLYYALVGLASGRAVWAAGSGLGLAAGLGAVFLPPALGLGKKPSQRTPQTAVMTTLWYLVGGLVAAGVAQKLDGNKSE